jgi:hypothetical protein
MPEWVQSNHNTALINVCDCQTTKMEEANVLHTITKSSSKIELSVPKTYRWI